MCFRLNKALSVILFDVKGKIVEFYLRKSCLTSAFWDFHLSRYFICWLFTQIPFFVGQCKEYINLAFVMDMSSSITSKNYPKEKDFVKNVADTFSISPTQTDVGVVTYNRDAKLWIRFGQYSNNDDFKKAVDKIPYWGGSTRIDNGLKMAFVELFDTIKGERAKLPKVLILLTDGKQNSDPRATPLEEAVLPLFQLGVKVFAVGVGDQISRDELRLIVEKDQDIFTVDDFDDLLAKSHQIARAACDEVKATERKLSLVLGL